MIIFPYNDQFLPEHEQDNTYYCGFYIIMMNTSSNFTLRATRSLWNIDMTENHLELSIEATLASPRLKLHSHPKYSPSMMEFYSPQYLTRLAPSWH